jgi:Beta-propeller repeat
MVSRKRALEFRGAAALKCVAVLVLVSALQLPVRAQDDATATSAPSARIRSGQAAAGSPVIKTAGQLGPTARGRVMASYGRLPLGFEANQGQTDGRVKFVSRGSGYTLFLTGNEAVIALSSSGFRSEKSAATGRSSVVSRHLQRRMQNLEPKMRGGIRDNGELARDRVLRMKLVGANRSATVSGADELPGKSNYFIGNDPRKWRTNVPNYAKVRYQGVYPGVDLVYYGNQGQLEYDFVVAPGADPRAITLAVNPASSGGQPLQVDRDGSLRMRLSGGEMVFQRPVVYQPAAADLEFNSHGATQVEGRYRLKGDHEVTFEVASYDRSRPLVIDPVLSYSSFLGGSGDDALDSISVAVDSAGNAYVASGTLSTDFPVTSGSFQSTFGGAPALCDQGEMFCGDAFVTKINAAGTAIVYSTYLGGSNSEYAFGLAVDASGNAYVTGNTESTNFPVTPGAFQPSYGGEQGPICDWVCGDTFVTKLNPSGSGLIYSSYLGGSGDDISDAIVFDGAGNAYVEGSTNSPDFPTTPGAFQTTFTGGDSCGGRGGGNVPCSVVFLTKINPAGTALVYSTYLGGSGGDGGGGLSVDSSGHAYVGGSTCSADFPITSNAYQTQNAGGCDASLTVFNAGGSKLAYSTFLGGNGYDAPYSLAIDNLGNAYLAGQTGSTDFPVTAGAIQTSYGGNGDAFVAKINPRQKGAASLVYSTYLGGPNLDYGAGVAVDALGNAYTTGLASSGFPVVNALQAAPNGISDAFVAELNPQGTELIYSTYLGGSSVEEADFCALDRVGNLYVAGWTRSADFPTTPRVFQPSFGGGNRDVFVVKISPANSPGVSFVPPVLTFGNQAVGTTSPPQTVLLHNVGSASLSISNIRAVGEFGETNTCGSSLAGGGSCAIGITFTPSAQGVQRGTLGVSDNAAGSPQRITLTGTGTP